MWCLPYSAVRRVDERSDGLDLLKGRLQSGRLLAGFWLRARFPNNSESYTFATAFILQQSPNIVVVIRC